MRQTSVTPPRPSKPSGRSGVPRTSRLPPTAPPDASDDPIRPFPPRTAKGRGALSNASGRFETLTRIDVDDGWHSTPDDEDEAAGAARARTVWREDAARTLITSNESPDLHFDRSINPYRGCEHGCIYCFARPSHAWLGHSPGLDFERRLYVKRDAPRLLREAFAKPGYRPEPIAIGVATDAWQPLERRLGVTRALLEVFVETRHPVLVITKSSLIERDVDLLADLARDDLVTATVTITTLDHALARRLEPRATAPARRLRTLETLARAGIPTRLSLSPVIPALNEHELETIVARAALAGAREANAIMLRLPHELGALFEEWLAEHYPDRAGRVMKAVRSIREGRTNDADFGTRMLGTGPRAGIIRRRFELACRRAGIACGRRPVELDATRFRAPTLGGQLPLL